MLLSRASTLGASSIEGDGEDHHRQGSLVAVGTGKRSAPQIRRGVDTCTATAARRRKRLLKDAAKISTGDGEPLKRYLGLVTCVQASEILKGSPPSSFVGDLLGQLIRLLPRAAASLDGASTFIECLQPFEDLENFVLPASFYRAVASAKDPPPPRPPLPTVGHNWRRKNAYALARETTTTDGGGGAENDSLLPMPQPSKRAAKITGLQTLRAYLCMNGRDSVDCGRRTLVTTLTRALLGAWEGSVAVGRELFDLCVLKSPDRSGPVGLGLEVLLQCLVQEEGGAFLGQFDAGETKDDYRDGEESPSVDRDDSEDNGDGSGSDSGSHAAGPSRASDRRRRRRLSPTDGARDTTPAPPPGPTAAVAADEARACVTIVGNYVRACGETSAAFFRDVLPAVLLMGGGAGGTGGSGRGGRRQRQRGGGGSGRVPRRLAALMRSLVVSTRSRNSFNVERMIIHTVKEVKDWGDPAATAEPYPPAEGGFAALDGDSRVGGATTGGAAKAGRKSGSGGGAGDKLRRRGLVLACLDVLGPTASCLSLIRQEMVDGESKASLRSAVADGLLEYRRTCDTVDNEGGQEVLLGVVSSLAEDTFLGVRLSALIAIGEGCSSDCVPAARLLLGRCLDTAPKVRALAIRLLVDEFRLGIGAAGASLPQAVLFPPPTRGQREGAMTAPDGSLAGGFTGERRGQRGGGRGGGGEVDGRPQNGGSGDGNPPLLGELLRHRNTLEESDKQRFPVLLRGLVAAALRSTTLPRHPRNTSRHGDGGGDRGGGAISGDSEDENTLVTGVGAAASAAAKEHPAADPWCGGRGVVAWEELDAPAARLSAACHPLDAAQWTALDEVLAGAAGLLWGGAGEA